MIQMSTILAAAETSDADLTQILQETQAVAVEVQQDLEQLKPNVILETVKGWTPGLLSFGYRLVVALIILFIASRIARMVKKFFNKTLERMGWDMSVNHFLSSVASTVIYALGIFIAADKIGIPSASIIALLGSAGLAIGLSLQGSLANVAGGILIMLMRPFGVGDYIVLNGVEGTVEVVGLVYTTLVTVDNKKITIPNGSVSNTQVVNVTAQDKRRVDVEVGISYTSDIKKAKEIMEQVYHNHSLILPEEDVTVFVSELADSAVIIGGRGWTATGNYWTVRWDVLEQVKVAYDEAGIEIPFNQLDVNVHNL